MHHIIVVYRWVLCFAFIYKYQVLGIFKAIYGHFLHIIVIYWWVLPFALIYNYQVFSNAMCFISLSSISRWVMSFAFFYKYQVFGIFNDYAIHVIVEYLWVLPFALIEKYQVLGIFKSMRFISIWLVNGHASQLGLVFCSYIKILGIRYFQRPCASYHFGILCILVGSCLLLIQTILGIRYFHWPCIFIIVVCQASLRVLYFALRFHRSIYTCVC